MKKQRCRPDGGRGLFFAAICAIMDEKMIRYKSDRDTLRDDLKGIWLAAWVIKGDLRQI